MQLPLSIKFALGAVASIAVLSSCSASSNIDSRLAPPVSSARLGVAYVNALRTPLLAPGSALPRRLTGTHPIPPNCCAHVKTLFVSSPLTSSIAMFEFPSNKYIGQVAAPPEGFGLPEGMCNDDKGDIYVPNSAEFTVDEYAHDGTYIRSLSEKGEYSVACAFDRSTGDLAVSNETDVENGPGSLSIYTNATGSPTTYTSSIFARIFFLSYMGKTGVLYFDGENGSNKFAYGSFSKGKMKSIAIRGATIQYPGTVAYSAKTNTMNVGDQLAAVLYQVSPSGKVIGSTALTGSKDVPQGTIKGGRFIAPDSDGGVVRVYPYPAGGNPESTIDKNLNEPACSAVSSPHDDSN